MSDATPRTLPPLKCPLCRFLMSSFGSTGSAAYCTATEYDAWARCDNKYCELHRVVLSQAAWRRIASPPVHDTVREVLSAVEDNAWQGSKATRLALAAAHGAWIAAGRPGLDDK